MPVDDAPVRHVLMTADAVGGVWTYALELATALARLGVRTTLATMGEALRPEQRDAASGVPGLLVEESSFKLEWMERPWQDVADAGQWLLDLERRERPDVVHLNGYCHGALPWSAPRLVVAHSCVLSWWRAVLGARAPAKYDRYRAEVGRGLRGAEAIVAPTRAMLESVRAHYAVRTPGHVVPNGVEIARFSVGAKEPFVLAAGRLWDEAKNLGLLASIAPRVSWPVYVAGSLRAPGGEERGADGVRALGWLAQSDLRAWMSRAAVYAAPARYEPFGLGVLEAALSGCALVLGDIPSLRETWADAALFVPPEDGAALLDAIEALADDDGLRMRMGELARLRGRWFGADRMARRYVDIYRRLVARRAGAGVRPCA